MKHFALMKLLLIWTEKEFRYLQNNVQNAEEIIDTTVHKVSLIM